jgi:RNA polymerase sigma factor (sigma-70 family)
MELARDLVARARSGDREAQAAFVAIYQDRVYAVCLALAGSDGEDCAQDTLVAALVGLRRFDPDAPGRLGTFVLQIARNRCVDRARSARVRTWSDVEVDELGGSGDVAADRLSRARDAEVVRRAVLELADDQRAVIALRTWGELVRRDRGDPRRANRHCPVAARAGPRGAACAARRSRFYGRSNRMMDPLDHDPTDELVRAARPMAPSRLASAVAIQLAARRSRRRATIGGASVLAAAAVVLLWIHHASDVPVAPPEHGPAIMLAVDAGTGSATIIPADAAAPDWTDMPALLAGLERAHRAAIASCRTDDDSLRLPLSGSAHALATFLIERQPDGSSRTNLVIHHSLGYLGYSWEEDCLQKVAASFGLPPLPPTLWSVAFTLAPPSSPSGGSAWLDPGRAGEDLLAPVRTRLEACVHGARVPHAQQAKAVFEPGGAANRNDHALAHVRIVLDDRATGEMIKCVSRVARDIAVPALPEPVDYIMLALTLPP